MFTKRILFKGFDQKKKNPKIINYLNELKKKFYNNSNSVLVSLSKNYKYSFDIKKIKNFKKYKNFRIFGMGGSILGAEAIYFFLKKKNKKKFFFYQ